MNDTQQVTSGDLAVATGESSLRRFLKAAARPTEILLGLFFLASAILKAVDVNDFIVAIGFYGVVSDLALKTASALGTLAVETALGGAMLLGMRPRGLILGATALLLVFFSGLIAYAWAFHGLEDCGCIGAIKMGPGASLVKNAALLAMCGVAWFGFRARGPVSAAPRRVLVKGAVAALLAAAVVGYSYASIKPPAPPTPRPYAKYVFEEEGVTYDLGKGEYFVAMLSTTCDHCQAAVEELNEISKAPGAPTVVGLCLGTEDQLADFRDLTLPEFPTRLIPTQEFFPPELPSTPPPRYVYVRDGVRIQYWDEELPKPEELAQARQLSAPSGPPAN